MKRILLVIVIWIVFVGGLAVYMRHREASAVGGPKTIVLKAAAGNYTLEVTPTFSAAPDPFALQVDEAKPAAALVVRLDTTELLRLSDTVEKGKTLRVEKIQGLVEGENEIFLQASPPTGEGRSFVQLRLLRDETPVAEEVFWSEGGLQVTGSLRYTIRPDTSEDHDDH